MQLWEILVPTTRNDGRPYRLRYHRVWDAKVREISGGMSVMPPLRGQWVSDSGKLFSERMIPVRVACSREDILKIIQMTIEYYDQEAVMAYKVSDEVLIVAREKK